MSSKKYKNVPSTLPPQIQALFVPGPRLSFLPPLDAKRRKKTKHKEVSGIAEFVDKFEQEQVEYDPEGQAIRTIKYSMPESRRKRKENRQKDKASKVEINIRKGLQEWDPNNDTKATTEPFNTLFISKMNYETTEDTLRNAFGKFGLIKTVRVVRDPTTNKSRGYAFVEFEKHEDMKEAYKLGDGMEIDQWRVLVDVERGRTVKDWKPRRLGGGLGNSRDPPPPIVEEKVEEFRPPAVGGGGGFRKSFGGGGGGDRRGGGRFGGGGDRRGGDRRGGDRGDRGGGGDRDRGGYRDNYDDRRSYKRGRDYDDR